MVVELAGGLDGPREWARATLDRGAPYVTANKALLATHGGELAEIAERRVAALLGSASVGGGTPMIETTTHLAATGALRGCAASSTPRRPTSSPPWADGRSYAEAVAEAQKAGYAEADPSFDVEGRDAAQKLAILASVAWGRWRPESDVAATGIVGLDVEAGATVRLVAEATEAGMSVAPSELDRGRSARERPRDREHPRDRPRRRQHVPRQRARCRRARDRGRRLRRPGEARRRGAADPVRARLIGYRRPVQHEPTDWHWPIVGVAGARGVVGSVFCSILCDAGLPPDNLRAFGHEAGNTIDYDDVEVAVEVLD